MDALAELLALFGSVAVDSAVASFVIVPGAPVSILIVTVTSAPLAMLPMEQMTLLPGWTQLPCVIVALTNDTPLGSESLTETLVAVAGPLLCTPSVYVSCWPERIGSGESEFVSTRSATGSTVVVALAALFTRTGSAVAADTLAWFVIELPDVGVTVMVTLAFPPLATEPRLQVTVPLACEQLPWVGVAELNVTPPGRVSVTVTPVAPEGPAFAMPKV